MLALAAKPKHRYVHRNVWGRQQNMFKGPWLEPEVGEEFFEANNEHLYRFEEIF